MTESSLLICEDGGSNPHSVLKENAAMLLLLTLQRCIFLFLKAKTFSGRMDLFVIQLDYADMHISTWIVGCGAARLREGKTKSSVSPCEKIIADPGQNPVQLKCLCNAA